MNLTISYNDKLFAVEVSGSLSLDDFKAYIDAETDVAPHDQVLVHNSKTLSGAETLDRLGVKDNDMIVLHKRTGAAQAPAAPPQAAGADARIETLRNEILNNPQLKESLRVSNPPLHAVLDRPTEFARLASGLFQQLAGGDYGSRAEEMARLQQDPDNPENQARILELIRQEQIDENQQLAYELTPEAFTSVSMLYIPIKVNGHAVQAFVDTGAQSTIISPKLAAEIGIDRLIDRRYMGEARGVGSQKIQGRIHSVPISIGDSNIDLPCSFLVLDTQVDLLFGLDMLRRHKCVVDLEHDKLIVGGGSIETRFLREAEIENNDLFGSSGNKNRLTLGGNIFSDAPVAPSASNSNSNPPKKNAASAAAEAAAKRQNVGTEKKYKEEDIQQLVGLGFSRKEAEGALDSCQGNVEMAASLLFQ